jgi:hypothetical protein
VKQTLQEAPAILVKTREQNTMIKATSTSKIELNSYATKAFKVERAICQVSAALDAIHLGGLLDAAPAPGDDCKKHSAAVMLISVARQSLIDLQALPGADLSIFISGMASEAA